MWEEVEASFGHGWGCGEVRVDVVSIEERYVV